MNSWLYSAPDGPSSGCEAIFRIKKTSRHFDRNGSGSQILEDETQSQSQSNLSLPSTNEAVAEAAQTILLVSGDDYLRATIRSFLEHVGFCVISCTDTARATNVLSTTLSVNLVLIDLNFSRSEMASLKLQGDGKDGDVPVVVLAGPRLADEETRAIASQGWTLLRKPLRLTELLGVIRRAFDPDSPPLSAAHRVSVGISPVSRPAIREIRRK